MNGTVNRRLLMLIVALSTACELVLADAIDTLQPGRWYEVPNSRLSAVLPDPTPRSREAPAEPSRL